MKDFDKNFEKRSREFDRDFSRMKKLSLISGIVAFTLVLGIIGFAIWVVITLMQFYGVI